MLNRLEQSTEVLDGPLTPGVTRRIGRYKVSGKRGDWRRRVGHWIEAGEMAFRDAYLTVAREGLKLAVQAKVNADPTA